MLYRLLAATIVIFWLAMTGLLVRKEFWPRDSSLREVPVEHVLKMMFAHEEASELQLYNEQAAIGHLRVQPRIRTDDGRRRLEFSGTLRLALPGVNGRQHVAWTGEIEMDRELQPQVFRLAVSYRDPAPHTMDLQLDFPQQQISFETHVDTILARRATYSLDANGASAWLREQGLDPGLARSLQNSRAAAMSVKARQSSLEVRGEKIETWLITAEQGGQTLFETHVSQLGQILRARTFLGYAAAAEDLAP